MFQNPNPDRTSTPVRRLSRGFLPFRVNRKKKIRFFQRTDEFFFSHNVMLYSQ